MSAIFSVLITALMRVVVSVATAPVAEAVMRRVLIHSIKWIVNSTQNTVDDEMVAPILRELDALEHLDSLSK